MITIAVDASGGDHAPAEVVKGAAAALKDPKLKLILLGAEPDIKAELDKIPDCDRPRLEIVNAPEVIGNDEHPTAAIKAKKNSSIVVGLNMLKRNEAAAFISAGSTGALLTGATVIVGRIRGIDRPILGTELPSAKGFTLLLDSGANVDSKPAYLAQYAQVGAVYAEHIMNIPNPKVGLINVGAEKGKGNELTKEAYPLLEAAGVNFTGNVEARDIPFGAVDVAVCDAFVGNVLLKYSEGMADAMFGMITAELRSSVISKIGGALVKSKFRKLKKSFSYSEVGGAPFLGLKSLVVKAHGSSKARAFEVAIGKCALFAERDITGKIEALLAEHAVETRHDNA
ncbi:MAG: phosphate acyltransferase PlsX [Defluviitaleaceae bacterium]|nr:phosphate acyltransferase PlsX [Defluviitaleaceae bacterium]